MNWMNLAMATDSEISTSIKFRSLGSTLLMMNLRVLRRITRVDRSDEKMRRRWMYKFCVLGGAAAG